MEETLSKFYYEPEKTSAFAGAYHLFSNIRKKFDKTKVKNWLNEQDAYSQHRLVRKKFSRRMYNISNILDSRDKLPILLQTDREGRDR